MEETYIGDGLYASIVGGMIKLRAPRPFGDHEVYLEHEVFFNLLKFIKENNPWPSVNLS